MSNRVRIRSFAFPVASMWMHRSGQTRSHWKQMMQRSLSVSWSIGSASSPCQREDTFTFWTGYDTVTLGSNIVRKVALSPVTKPTRPRHACSARDLWPLGWIGILIGDMSSAVDIGQHDVDAPQDGNHVGDFPPAHHFRQRIQVAERRRADLDTVGLVRALANEVDPEIPPRGLGTGVHFAFGQAQRDCDLRPDLAGGELFQALADDAHALPHLFQSHEVAGKAVPLGAHRYVKLYPLIHLVGMRLPHIVGHPGRPGDRPGRAHGDGLLSWQHAHPLCAG